MNKISTLICLVLISFLVSPANASGPGRYYGGNYGNYFGGGYYGIPYNGYYPGYGYPPPNIGSPPEIKERSGEPILYIEPGDNVRGEASDPNFRYYCQNPQGYYPDIEDCSGGWRKVPASSIAPLRKKSHKQQR